MKLKLEEKNGITHLQVDESVDAQALSVLKAGLKKLLFNGKNRIIIELLSHQTSLPNEFFREIAILNLNAAELSGQIMVLIADPELRKKAEVFFQPKMLNFIGDAKDAEKAFAAVAKPVADEEGEANPLQAEEINLLKSQVHELTESLSAHRKNPLSEAAWIEREKILMGEIKELQEKLSAPPAAGAAATPAKT